MKDVIVFCAGLLLMFLGFYLTNHYFPWNLPLNFVGGILLGFAGTNMYDTIKRSKNAR